jgi:hypothetical protein
MARDDCLNLSSSRSDEEVASSTCEQQIRFAVAATSLFIGGHNVGVNAVRKAEVILKNGGFHLVAENCSQHAIVKE